MRPGIVNEANGLSEEKTTEVINLAEVTHQTTGVSSDRTGGDPHDK